MKAVQRKFEYTTGEIAKLCGVSINAVCNWEREGQLCSVRVGKGDRRFSHADVVGFLRRSGVPMGGIRIRVLAYGVPDDMEPALRACEALTDELDMRFAESSSGLYFEVPLFRPHVVIVGEGLSRREAGVVQGARAIFADVRYMAYGAYAAGLNFDRCIPADATPEDILITIGCELPALQAVKGGDDAK